MPLTREKAFVQVKTKTSQQELDNYIERKKQLESYDRMFFVYHTSRTPLHADEHGDVTVIDAITAANLVVESGLVDWVIDKVY
jgi:hypothetical protein